jgi:hypothetical protein
VAVLFRRPLFVFTHDGKQASLGREQLNIYRLFSKPPCKTYQRIVGAVYSGRRRAASAGRSFTMGQSVKPMNASQECPFPSYRARFERVGRGDARSEVVGKIAAGQLMWRPRIAESSSSGKLRMPACRYKQPHSFGESSEFLTSVGISYDFWAGA